jgi:sugar/nucleoside kinase (ribokinase family)
LKPVTEAIAEIKALLEKAPVQGPRALLGFDGYVDTLYRVVRQRNADGKIIFEDIHQFGSDILTRAGRSGGFELQRISERMGGNAPLMAAALAAQSLQVDVVGALGQPEINPAFANLAKSAKLHSIASNGVTVALEFDDGKIMLGDTESFEAMDWAWARKALGLEKISALASQASLLALVNWANMPKATELWGGLLDEVLAKASAGPKKKIFFDLADLTRCAAAETKALAALLGRFRPCGEVILGLNENEAHQLAEKLDLGLEGGMEGQGQRLKAALPIDTLVVHPRDGALVFQGSDCFKVPGRLVEKPVLSTGGGDNFNAGFCAGLVQGLGAASAACMGVMVSSFYVAHGHSPNKEELLGWIKKL